MLLKGVRQKSTGEIEIRMHDQLAASDQLNRMAGIYVDKSISLVAHASASAFRPLKRGMSVEEALALMETLSPTATAPPPDDSVVSEQ